jgi:ribA/ribD-fused uncharacterized protein
MKITDEYVLFWNGIYSQWYIHPFSIDGVRYNCSEQYMMAEKARLFKDQASLDKIMATKDPRQQKALGRGVKGFVEAEWNKVCKEVVYEACMAKFLSDPKLKQQLLDTGDRIIVEASPKDKIWGIGLGEDDPRCLNPGQWLGTNWLGECLMRARSMIKAADDRHKNV